MDHHLCICESGEYEPLGASRVTISASHVRLTGGRCGAILVEDGAHHVVVQDVKVETIVWRGDHGCIRNVTFTGSAASALCLYHVHHAIIDRCSFYEIGAHKEHATAVLLQQCEQVEVTKCTMDGVVGSSSAHGITILSSTQVTVRDTFFTDIVCCGPHAQAVYAFDSDVDLVDVQETSVHANVAPQDVRRILDHVPAAPPTQVRGPLQVAHIRGVVPTDDDTLATLEREHTWRNFRNLGRLVCHNALRYPLCRAYADWTVRFCKDVLGVEVVVENAFSNLYLDGTTPLPLHRDHYNKWIFGLSFGETRTMDFVPDAPGEIVSFSMQHGDVLLFSPSVNEHWQHRMAAEPDRRGKRINITYFLHVDGDPNKLLVPPRQDIWVQLVR